MLDDLFQAASIPEENDVETSGPAPSIPFDYLSVVNELHSGRIKVSDSAASAEYRAVGTQIEELLREFDLRRAEIAPPPLEVEQWPSTEPADIARELALETHRRAEDLHGLAVHSHSRTIRIASSLICAITRSFGCRSPTC